MKHFVKVRDSAGERIVSIYKVEMERHNLAWPTQAVLERQMLRRIVRP